MSALPPKADIGTQSWNVRFVPKADICGAANCNLFDHFVGRGEQRRRNSHAKGLCTFEIEREYKFSWLLDRKISRIRALQNSINVIGGALTRREYVRAIGDESARSDIFAIFVDGRQTDVEGKIDYFFDVCVESGRLLHDKRIGASFFHRFEGVTDLLGPDFENLKLDLHRSGGNLRFFDHRGSWRVITFHQNGDPGEVR